MKEYLHFKNIVFVILPALLIYLSTTAYSAALRGVCTTEAWYSYCQSDGLLGYFQFILNSPRYLIPIAITLIPIALYKKYPTVYWIVLGAVVLSVIYILLATIFNYFLGYLFGYNF